MISRRPYHLIAIALALAIACGCSLSKQRPAAQLHALALDAAVADPEALGWSTAGLKAIRREAQALDSAAVLIITAGQVVFMHGDIDRNFRAHSMRKSLLSALYGIAIAKGQIDPGDTLAELGIDDKTPLTVSERQATVADLLAARSGIYLPAASEVPAMRAGRPARHQYQPGTHWYYNNWDFNVLGSIYRQQTGEDIFEAFARQIAGPIGMQDYGPANTRYQFEDMSLHPSYKFRISTRDLARFGLLYLHKGRWQGTEILPAEWVETSTRAHSLTGRNGTKGGYGLMWWVSAAAGGKPAPRYLSGAYTASGSGGHRLTVLPAIDTVLVHRTDTDDRGGARMGSSAYDRFLAYVLRARLTTATGS